MRFYMMSVVNGPTREKTHISSRLYELMRCNLSKAQKYNQASERNSQAGTFWAFNEELKESKKFRRSEELPEGWKVGRVLDWANFDPAKREPKLCKTCGKSLPKGHRVFCSTSCRNRHHYTTAKKSVKIKRGNETKFIKPQDLAAYRKTGWILLTTH
jgi:endogenous inhibitor of DNA gyrase (YacG/DUF329 family)